MENYDCNSGCGGCSGGCGGAYSTSSMNDVYSQKNSYSLEEDDEEQKRRALFGGY